MKKMTVKLILISIITMVISSVIPNIIWKLFGEGTPREANIEPGWILLAAILTVTASVTIYSIIINKVIVQRVRILNDSTKKVINGDYDMTIVDKHRDELSELSNSFNEMTNALQQNEYVSKNFIRNFSHEYKTPLSTIKGYAELIQDEDHLSKDTKEYLEIIVDESNRLSQLSYNMLLISQIDHQIIIPKEDELNITEELRKVIQMKQLMFEKKDLSFELDVLDLQVKTNQSLIYQAFSNIIDNAIKYTLNNQTIHIKFTHVGNHLKMVFSNPTKQTDLDESQLFNIFYTNQRHTTKSNGIGLSLVKKIIEKLGGQVNAKVDAQSFKLTLDLPINKINQ
ncbi:MAG: HAMP domain-containing sensor histidine kinase [Tenericutes bacterium]|jgi:signal transduction histidine kinase|nr:HAMP domain-containing sensor histidine kinase [Mycoplasmatota bacterium]